MSAVSSQNSSKEQIFTVMIADDESAIRSGLQEAIPWESYHARVAATAADGETALSYILSERPDLVVIDIKMPSPDGLEVIRRTREAGISTRFLILSGYDDFPLAQKAIRYGANGYFLKPLKIAEFRDELSRQFQDIAQEKSSRDSGSMEDLLTSSRLFFLNQLILNELRNSEEIERRARMLSLSWILQKTQLIIVSADAEAAILPSLLHQASVQAVSLFSLSPFEVWTHRNDQLLILFSREKASFSEDELKGLTADVVKKLSQQLGYRFFAALGKISHDAEQLSAGYASALRALSYHIYSQPGDVCDDTIICRQEPSFSPESVDFEPLITAIERNDAQSLEAYCRRFVRSLFFVELPPPDFLRAMCIYLLNQTRIRFLARHADFHPMLGQAGEDSRGIHSVEDLILWLTGQLKAFMKAFQTSLQSRDTIIETAREYVKSHLSSPIKAKDVAAVVNLSESYFTIYFKQKTGQNFRDYLLRERTDLARRLLAEHQKSIGEIAAATGYQDYRSFSRAFKNVTGVSPSEYQSNENE